MEKLMNPYKVAVEALDDGIAVFGASGGLVIRNASFCELLCPVRDAIQEGMTLLRFSELLRESEVYDAQSTREFSTHLGHSITEDCFPKDAFELSNANGDRHRVWIRKTSEGGVLIQLSKISAPAVLGSELTGEDVSLLLEAAPVCLTVFDLEEQRLLFQSPESIALFGKIDSHVSNTWWDDSNRPEFLKELREKNLVERFEVLARRSDNTPFPAQLSARIVTSRGRKLYVSTTYDMAQIYAARDELAASRQRLLDAMEALEQGFALFDADNRFVMANGEYRSVIAPISGHLEKGVDMHVLIEAARNAGLPAAAAGWVPGLIDFQLPDGRQMVVTRANMSDGGTVMMWQDVTEARATETELARRREAAFQSEKLTALGQLLAGVAHELNNPLSVVVGQALMLEEDVNDPDVSRKVARISKAAERCSKIVKTFLTMARQRPARIQPIQINDLVKTATEMALMGAAQRDLDVAFSLSDNLPFAAIDPDQMTQVVTNLVMNAKAALSDQPGGQVTIVTSKRGDQLVVEVIDNGTGVPDKLKARIFEPFFTTKEVNKGTGLGLALARQIVLAHSGTIEVRDAPLGGACFAIGLPISLSTALPDNVEQPSMASPARVLVVEDEQDVADIIIEVLERDGLDVTHAENGGAALRLLENDTFDVILSDLRMPGIGGKELLEWVRAHKPDLVPRIAFVTGDAMSDDAEELRQIAGSRFLEKPGTPRELREIVSLILKEAVS